MSMSVALAVAEAQRRLAAAGVAEPRLDAQVLMGHVLACGRAGVLSRPDRLLDDAEAARFAGLVAGRAARRPVSQLVEEREFWSLPFRVTPDVLTPRPDSETVVAAALGCIADRTAPVRLLDLGTGSGCLLLALLHELPAARGIGVDRSGAALAVARGNALRLGLAGRGAFVQGSWASALRGPFDLAVANPPYIPDAAIAALEPEVARFEPRGALAGGPDGLDAYRQILGDLARVLAPGGRLVVEIGDGQAAGVTDIAGACGWSMGARHADLAGRIRALVMVSRETGAAQEMTWKPACG